MTDLASRPETEASSVVPAAAQPAADPDLAPRPVEAADRPRRRRWPIVLGAAVGGVVVVGAVVASTMLIAPGVTIAGTNVGWMTPGAARDAIDARLATAEISVDGSTVTGKELGAGIDARSLTESAFGEHPLWKVGSWNPDPIAGDITFDSKKATETLRAAAPELFRDPVDATLAFDAAAGGYAVNPAEAGTGVDMDALAADLSKALADGEGSVAVEAKAAKVAPAVSTKEAQSAAGELGALLGGIGFYVGDERTVPVDAATAASWLTVDVSADGALDVSADPAKIAPAVAQLPDLVDRQPVTAENVVNSGGHVLEVLKEGVTGRALGSTDGIADAFAAQLDKGDGAYALEVNETPFQTTSVQRTVDVNLSAQTVTAYENGQAVGSWAVSTGLDGSPTHEGNFTVGWQTPMQNMGNRDLTKAPNYFQPDVPWVTYFNGDEAFHGTYWHDNFGSQMSHGCVNMPVAAAKFIYEFTTEGTEVSVHY